MFVCPSLHAEKGKRLELSTPNLIHMCRLLYGSRSSHVDLEDKRSRSHGYKSCCTSYDCSSCVTGFQSTSTHVNWHLAISYPSQLVPMTNSYANHLVSKTNLYPCHVVTKPYPDPNPWVRDDMGTSWLWVRVDLGTRWQDTS